jgi:hypothetical protein
MNEAIKRINLGAEFWTPEKCYIIELSNAPDDPEASIARARVKRETPRGGIGSSGRRSVTSSSRAAAAWRSGTFPPRTWVWATSC